MMTMSCSQGIIWLEYQLNKDFISQNLCINKSKPKLHCNGKCQMMKKMAEEEHRDAPIPFQKLKAGFGETDFPCYAYLIAPVKEFKTRHNRFPPHFSYASPVFPVFRPPA
jgi:hypothetical protein